MPEQFNHPGPPAPAHFRLFVHPQIYTLDPACPLASWMLTLGTTIVATGQGQPPALPWPAETIRLPGAAVVPGFIDAHGHVLRYTLQYANTLSPKERAKLGLPESYCHWLDLSAVTSKQQLLNLVATRVATMPSGQWIIGGGWTGFELIPDCRELDNVSPHHPLLLVNATLHSALVNSLALKLSEISEDSWDPRGGKIARDPASLQPTGQIYEEAITLVEKRLPVIATSTWSRLISKTLRHFNSEGIVGVHDMESTARYDPYPPLAHLLATAPEEFTVRFVCSLKLATLDHTLKCGRFPGSGNDYLRVGGVKLIHDGALGAGTALMKQTYPGATAYYGEELLSRGEIRQIARECIRRRVPLTIHAIGDRAVENVSEVLEEYCLLSHQFKLRHRIEHIQWATPEIAERLLAANAVFSVQPRHLLDDLPRIAQLQPHLLPATHAYRTLLTASYRSSAYLALGTDFPVVPLSPLENIYVAVTRRDFHGHSLANAYDFPENHLSIAEAITGYTLGAAYAAGEEQRKGSLAPGKLADFIILSMDIFQQPAETIPDTRVIATYIGAGSVFP